MLNRKQNKKCEKKALLQKRVREVKDWEKSNFHPEIYTKTFNSLFFTILVYHSSLSYLYSVTDSRHLYCQNYRCGLL